MRWYVRKPFILALMLTFALLPIGNQMMAQQVGKIVNTNPINVSATGFTQIVAPIATLSVEVNNFGLISVINASTGQTVTVVSCTDATCSTGSTPVTGVLTFVGPGTTSGSSLPVTMVGNPVWVTTPGSGLFTKTTGTQSVTGWVTFNQR